MANYYKHDRTTTTSAHRLWVNPVIESMDGGRCVVGVRSMCHANSNEQGWVATYVHDWQESWPDDWTRIGSNFTAPPGGRDCVMTYVKSTVTRRYDGDRYVMYHMQYQRDGTVETATKTLRIPRIPYEAPRAPKDPYALYESDTSVLVAWTRDSDGANERQHWQNVVIYRSTDGGGYARVATLGGGASSWRDVTVGAGHVYAYIVASSNSRGETRASTGGDLMVTTTPASPRRIAIEPGGNGYKLFVYFDNSNRARVDAIDSIEVYQQVDGGTWEHASSSTPSSRFVDGYVEPSSPTGENHRYRWYAVSSATTPVRHGVPVGGRKTLVSKRLYTDTYRTRPAGPASLAAARESDTRMNLTWALGPNAANTYGGISIQRSDDGGDYADLASVSATATAWSDTTVGAGHVYRYRIAAYNEAGASDWVASGDISTAPSAPTLVTTQTVSRDTVSVDATGTLGSVTGYELQHRVGADGAWGDARRATSLPVDMPAADGANYYRVRAYRNDLVSGWATSGPVYTLLAPLAPTIIDMRGVYAVGGSCGVKWRLNHPDGSAQTAAQVEVTTPDGRVDVRTSEGAAQAYPVTGLVEGTYLVRVRTHGAYQGYGEWSGYAAFSAHRAPAVAVTSPTEGGTVSTVPLRFEWAVTDPTGVMAQSVTVFTGAGKVVAQAEVEPGARSYDLYPPSSMPANGARYRFEVSVTGGSTLASSASAAFSFQCSTPSAPVASVTIDSGLSCHVCVGPGATEGAVATESISVERVMSDGSSSVIADGMVGSQEAIDKLPPLNTRFTYEVVAHAASGAEARTMIATVVDSGGMEAFNFGPHASTCLRLGLNTSARDRVGHNGETFHFATGRDAAALPTFYPERTMESTGSRSYLITDVDQYRQVRDVARAPSNSVCWFRDFWGGCHRVRAGWELGYSSDKWSQWDVSVDLTEVEWEEPLNG